MNEMTGKMVEVGTVEAVYTGKLIEVNEDELHLETETGWIVVPIDRVAYVREIAEE